MINCFDGLLDSLNKLFWRLNHGCLFNYSKPNTFASRWNRVLNFVLVRFWLQCWRVCTNNLHSYSFFRRHGEMYFSPADHEKMLSMVACWSGLSVYILLLLQSCIFYLREDSNAPIELCFLCADCSVSINNEVQANPFYINDISWNLGTSCTL